jgi:(1->4)-alpha-D-glucan 1-alpha-D-glucosylmutase
MLKAVREARWRSSWANPHEEYERALQRFIAQILDPVAGQLFLKDFLPFQARVARAGMLASLVQLTLKLTCPGMPDLYQGCEFWDLSLVDPDNRRPVDFEARIQALGALADAERTASAAGQRVNALREQWQDGWIKLHLLWRLLRLREALPNLFARGDYQPCAAEGPMAEHVCAFARGHGETRMVVAVARHLAPYLAPEATIPEPATWSGTILRLAGSVGTLQDVLTGQTIDSASGTMLAGQLFTVLPVTVLVPPADLARLSV